MDLVTMRVFAAIADAESVTGAARRLHLAPSAVTTRLRRLEAELGHALFDRGRRGMILTPKGRVLLDYAHRLLALAEDAARAVAGEDGTPRGRLRIGATDTAATVYLPSVFAAYHERWPAVALEVSSNVSEALIDDVRRRRLDAAIVARDVRAAGLTCRRIRRERLVLASSRSIVDVYGLSRFTYLSSRAGGVQRARIAEWLAQSHNPPLQVIELPSLALRLSCAAAGMGVTVVTETALAQSASGDALRTHPIPEPWCWQDSFFLRAEDGAPFPARTTFETLLFDLLAEDVGAPDPRADAGPA